jgi:DNA-binding transcriptional MocR family regulator
MLSPDVIAPNEMVPLLGTWSRPDRPLYAALADAIVHTIDRGEIAAESRLPAERDLAAALSISRTTVVSAYDRLAMKAYVERRRGSGTYVARPPQPRRRTSALIPPIEASSVGGADLAEVVNLNAAAMTATGLITPDFVRDALLEAPDSLASRGYDVVGREDLRALIADRLGASGLPTDPAQIVVTSGAQQAIMIALSLLAKPGDRVLVEDPSPIGTLDAIYAARLRAVGVPSSGRTIEVAALERALRRDTHQALAISPTVHNPTGGLLDINTRRAVAALADEYRLPIIEDSALADVTYVDRVPPPLAAFATQAPVFLVGSLSKLYWGGLRLGWLRADERYVGDIARLKIVFDYGTSMISQVIGAKLLRERDTLAPARIQAFRGQLDFLESLLAAHLPDWTWERPDGGLALWVKLPGGASAELAQVAQRFGVVVASGTRTSVSKSYTDHLRIPFVHEPRLLEAGIVRLASAWRSYRDDFGRRPGIDAIV